MDSAQDLGSIPPQLKWAGECMTLFVELRMLQGWREGAARVLAIAPITSRHHDILFLLSPTLLWTGVQAARCGSGFPLAAGPVGYRCDYLSSAGARCGKAERGMHCAGYSQGWPAALSRGHRPAIGRAEFPYIPTEKRAVRGVFIKLAWPQLALVLLYIVTIVRLAAVRIFETAEARLELTSEAIWGMVAFATLPMIMSLGGVIAAWQSSRPRDIADAWETIEPPREGGA